MDYLEGLKKNSTVTNSKGGKYYASSYDANLDVFAMLSRYNSSDEIINKFKLALNENNTLALANLLYILDIRNGKGERRLFKIIYEYLCSNYPEYALQVLPFISKLGRFDYVLIGMGTKIEKEIVDLIKKQLKKDIKSESPSLLAKWLPSIRTHKQNNKMAKKLVKLLGMSEKEYRKMLKKLRQKINIVETNLTEKTYDKIDFSHVPSLAMIKYREAFSRNMWEKFMDYKKNLKSNKTTINTQGLFCYQIIKNVLFNKDIDSEILDLMWQNQKQIVTDKNLLVIADTSGSMFNNNAIPFCTSVGLAIYAAQHNKGIFKNHFITFSNNPYFQEIKGSNISEIVNNIISEVGTTDIDKVFELLLNTAIKGKVKQDAMPSHILLISDMEFDEGVLSKGGTNLEGWRVAFQEKGYQLPSIIYWNVALNSLGIPITKYEEDVAIVSGFSINILENLLTLDKYRPVDLMLDKLTIYLEMLNR